VNQNAWRSAKAVASVPDAPDEYVDDGNIRCSSFELTDTGGARVRNSCYTGGIGFHQARGWDDTRKH